MQIVKMFAALLVAVCAAQTFASQARAEVPTKMEAGAETGCGWKRPYSYRYHYHYSVRRPSPFQRPRAPHPRRKVDPND